MGKNNISRAAIIYINLMTLEKTSDDKKHLLQTQKLLLSKYEIIFKSGINNIYLKVCYRGQAHHRQYNCGLKGINDIFDVYKEECQNGLEPFLNNSAVIYAKHDQK